MVESINKKLTKLKNIVKSMPKDEVSTVEENKKIIDIAERILELISEKKKQGSGLKTLTPNQMLSRLPITLAQLKAGSNSEKLKNEIRQLLYSLHRSKKLTRQLSEYKNNKFKIPAPTWNDTFDLLDGSYSIEDIQDYFEFIIKKPETLTENPPIQIYPNKIKNRMFSK